MQSGHDSVHRRTDGQSETSIHPFQLRWSWGITNWFGADTSKCSLRRIVCWNYADSWGLEKCHTKIYSWCWTVSMNEDQYAVAKLFIQKLYYNDVIMGSMTTQIPASRWFDQRKHQWSAPLTFVRGIHRWPVNSPHKGPVSRKMFSFDDVIKTTLARHNTDKHTSYGLSVFGQTSGDSHIAQSQQTGENISANFDRGLFVENSVNYME